MNSNGEVMEMQKAHHIKNHRGELTHSSSIRSMKSVRISTHSGCVSCVGGLVGLKYI